MRRSVSRRGQRDTRQRGATLTEILVILALLAMLSLLSIPALLDLLKSLEVREAASAMVSGIRRTQGLALQEHKTFFIVFNPQRDTTGPPVFCPVPPGRVLYAIVEDGGAEACRFPAGCSNASEKLREWGPPIPPNAKFTGHQGFASDAYDLGGDAGSSFHGTFCFNSRGYAHSEIDSSANRTGIYFGNDNKKKYRRIQANLTGRLVVQKLIGGTWRE